MSRNLDPRKSAQPCGCDEGENYLCERHRSALGETTATVIAVKSFSEVPVTSVAVSKATPIASPAGQTTEVRVVDPLTGGEKGSKIERFDLIPVEMETGLARHYGEGAKKYADRNWEKGYKWGLSYAALRRHLASWVGGESYDVCQPPCSMGCTNHTGSHHLICVIWHATALLIFELRGLGTDDIRRQSPDSA